MSADRASMARVSLIVPVRNHARYVADSLASIFAHDHHDLEVIVVDDGSTDDIAAAVAPWADRLRLIRQEPTGVAAARNRGARAATGDLLAFHDADDLMEPARLPALVACLAQRPEVGLAFGNGIEIDAAGTPGGLVIPPRQARMLARRGVRIEDLLRRSLIYPQASLVRRTVFDGLGGMPSFAAGSDWAFALRCVLHHPVAYVDRVVFRYRQHPGSLTAAKVASAAAAVEVLRDFVAREPTLAGRVGRRGVARALARRLGRLAARQLEAGNTDGARASLTEAATLTPFALKYRVRLHRLGRAGAPS